MKHVHIKEVDKGYEWRVSGHNDTILKGWQPTQSAAKAKAEAIARQL